MPPKYPNEEQKYSLFDEFLGENKQPDEEAKIAPEETAPPPLLNFDIFNFSLDELRAAEKARKESEAEDILALYDETPAVEPEELSAEEWAEEIPEPEEPAEEENDDDDPVPVDMMPEEEPEETEAEPDIVSDETEEALTEAPDAVLVEGEEEPEPEPEIVSEESEEELVGDGEEAVPELPEEAEEETAEEDESERASLAAFLSLFRRKNSDTDETGDTEAADIEDAAEDETEQLEDVAAEKKPGKLSLDKEKLFAMLYPKRKQEDAPAEDAEALEETGEAPDEPVSKAVRVVPSAAVAGPGVAQLPREPKAGEMLVYDTELDDIDYYDEEDLPELRDYMPVRFARYGRLGIGGGLMYALFVISLSIILACAAWLFASDVLALNKPDTTSVVTLLRYIPGPEDTLNEDGDPVDEEGRVIQVDVDQVASALKSGGVIDFKWLFKLFCEVSNADVKMNPGTYDVSAKLDYRALVTEMQVGSESQEITRITFPEGYNMEQIFQLLEDNGICDKDDLYEAAANHEYSYEWLEGLPLGDASRLEGYLFPDTYDFYQGENAINAIDRFLSNFHYMLTLDMLKQAENLGMSLHEIVTVASLIEKEAGAEDDRSRFASVIYNRLDAGWKLQLDSTINYIMGTSTFDLGGTDLEIESPYNTYLYEGLPVGPICSPGKASLVAALNPASTNDWFWFAHEGITYFFSSSSAFDEFAEAHRTW